MGDFRHPLVNFNHKRIIEFCNRPFKSVEAHDEALIDNWNEVVDDKDWVYHLGDFAFIKTEHELRYYLDQLKGNICFIRGNHDKLSRGVYTKNFKMYYHDSIAYINIDGERFHLCHYPILSWNGRHRGTVHFFGHIHSGPLSTSLDKDLPIQPNSWDCGVDNNNYRPIPIEEAVSLAKSHKLWEK